MEIFFFVIMVLDGIMLGGFGMVICAGFFGNSPIARLLRLVIGVGGGIAYTVMLATIGYSTYDYLFLSDALLFMIFAPCVLLIFMLIINYMYKESDSQLPGPVVATLFAAYVVIALFPFVAYGVEHLMQESKESETPSAEVSQSADIVEDSRSDQEATTTAPGEGATISTNYYTLTLPLSWETDSVYEIVETAGYGYDLHFYEKESYESFGGGSLFSILLLTDSEDYTVYPDYDVLGSVEVYRINGFNVVVTYPTDMQCDEKTIEKYNSMYAEVPGVLETLTFNEECTFSKTPIEVVAA